MTRILLDLTIDPATVEKIRGLPGVVVHDPERSHEPVERDPRLLHDIDVLLAKHPPKNFDDLKSLKLWQLATVGFDHFAHLHLGERPFTVCNARGVFDAGIGEWCAAMIVNLTRDLRGIIRDQEQGKWNRAVPYMQEVRGKVAGIWGYGGLGREAARVANALGLVVRVMVRRGVSRRLNDFTPLGTGDPQGVLPDRVFLTGQERDFLAGLDFLILALPRTRTTTGLIGEAELHMLPRTAFVLNPARGPIIQEQALIRALREGWIAGAALDTHYYYPMPPEHPLWHFPNVIMTPHVAGADRSARFPELVGELAVENVTRFVEGRPLLNVVSREELREGYIEPVKYRL
jgi:phosphoglycerate dehydrogenase-like enzyme